MTLTIALSLGGVGTLAVVALVWTAKMGYANGKRDSEIRGVQEDIKELPCAELRNKMSSIELIAAKTEEDVKWIRQYLGNGGKNV